MKREKISITDVRNSISNQLKLQFTVKYIGRPLANHITPFFYNYDFTANSITYIRITLSVFSLIFLVFGSYYFSILAFVLFFISFVLDFVDGNIARLSQDVTYWGKFIDGLCDMAFVFLAPISAGIGIWNTTGETVYILVGGACGTMSMLSQLARNRLSFMREWMTSQSGPVTAQTNASLEGVRRLQGIVASFYVNASFFTPFFLLMPDYGHKIFVLAMVIAQLIPEVFWLGATLAEGRILLARTRRSIHSPSESELKERLGQDKETLSGEA